MCSGRPRAPSQAPSSPKDSPEEIRRTDTHMLVMGGGDQTLGKHGEVGRM